MPQYSRRRCLLITIAGLFAGALALGAGCKASCPYNAPHCQQGFQVDHGFKSPLPVEQDRDQDGLSDHDEQQLAERFAPVVTLHKDDWTRPASIDWLLDKLDHRSEAELVPPVLGRFSHDIRKGSDSPSDWVTYTHVYPAGDGQGIYLQYWFFYPYNDGYLIFDHESDWEHVTVALNAEREPLGMWTARHGNNQPGVWRAWSDIRKVDGTHPEVLSAKGSHASYFDEHDVGWQDTVGRCEQPDDQDCQHRRWRTWLAGGLRNMGERHAPLDMASMKHKGLWGSDGLLPGTSAPLGPAYQRGWCVAGGPPCIKRAGF